MKTITTNLNRQIFILIILCLSISSCKHYEEVNLSTDTALKFEKQVENIITSKAKVYTLIQSCPELFKGMDFSDMCFTNQKTPTYKTGDMAFTKNRCQFTLADGELEFAVVIKDYTGLDPEEIEMRNAAEKQAFMQMNKMEFKLAKPIDNLGDYAVLNEAHISDPNTKRLSIRQNNILIYIEAHKDFCSGSDEDLEKMGRMVLKSVTN
jgi:hypothetical protein